MRTVRLNLLPQWHHLPKHSYGWLQWNTGKHGEVSIRYDLFSHVLEVFRSSFERPGERDRGWQRNLHGEGCRQYGSYALGCLK